MAMDSLEMNGDADRNGETEVPLSGPRRRQTRPLNMNHYANKKSMAESMLDVALLMANASQLKAVLEEGPAFSFYVPLIVLISVSLILQIIVGIMLIFIVKWNLNDERMHYKLNIMENVATAFVFIIVVVNVFITAFGVQRPNTSQ
ncbi:ninjurin-1 isoform X2 [Dunckerocampus dactyliophorus]|uniref:ninjurin-1 isoform X2 n=1 Tax=Dunckerocampus dactyliophorus TaxID=161453 RepID=UPI002405F008|nr:ninjurin-1 isoform X2 [Dunckerocampus dactyliophorus]